MRERGLRWHDMANKKLAYFFTSRSAAKIIHLPKTHQQENQEKKPFR
jgi:hypothetical protein